MSNTKNDEVMQELTAEDIAQISGGINPVELEMLISQTNAQNDVRVAESSNDISQKKM
jgi:hypothetical protein